MSFVVNAQAFHPPLVAQVPDWVMPAFGSIASRAPAPAPFVLPPLPPIPQLVTPLPQQPLPVVWNNTVIPQIPPPNLDFLKAVSSAVPPPGKVPDFDFSPIRNLVVKEATKALLPQVEWSWYLGGGVAAAALLWFLATRK